MRTPLCDRLSASGARLGEYRGAETARSFGDTSAELNALRSSAGLVDFGFRAKLIVAGSDRQKWLNGMLTNNLRDLATDRGTYNFLLNAQGRILADMNVYNRGEYLLIDTDIAQREKVLTTLDHFIIMDDVELSDASDKLTALAVIGPAAGEILNRAGFSIPPLEPLQVADFAWNGIGASAMRLPERENGYEIWSACEAIARLWDALREAGARPAGADALEIWRVLRGIPLYGQDLRDLNLPQETEQHHALDFTKGCYIGQEIVERIRSRGAVHRTFTGFRIEGPPPASGTTVTLGGKEVGVITSAVAVPNGSGSKTLALGYIRREAAGGGNPLQAGDAAAVVSSLPFDL
jgi:folate-binding protein YgfZ